jgi:hypothetical protein
VKQHLSFQTLITQKGKKVTEHKIFEMKCEELHIERETKIEMANNFDHSTHRKFIRSKHSFQFVISSSEVTIGCVKRSETKGVKSANSIIGNKRIYKGNACIAKFSSFMS